MLKTRSLDAVFYQYFQKYYSTINGIPLMVYHFPTFPIFFLDLEPPRRPESHLARHRQEANVPGNGRLENVVTGRVVTDAGAGRGEEGGQPQRERSPDQEIGGRV